MFLHAVAVLLSVAGAVCGIIASRQVTVRIVSSHLVAVAAMVWMVFPTGSAGIGRHVWAAVLLVLMLWTAFSHVRGGVVTGSRIVAAREIAELAATSVLVVLLPSSSHRALPALEHGHAAVAAGTTLPIVIVLFGWASAVIACAAVSHRNSASRRSAALGSFSAGLMVAGMGIMAGMSIVS
jgi:hypothetical protein